MAANNKSRVSTPWSVLYSKKITSTEKVVFMVLKDRIYNQDKNPNQTSGWISHIDWIADNIGMSYDSVKKALKSLRDKNIINVKRVKVHQKVLNQFFINWEMIEKGNEKHQWVTKTVEECDMLDEEPTEPEVTDETITPPAEEEKTVISIEIKKEQSEEEEKGYAATTVEDVINNPELSFLLEDDEMTLEDEVTMAVNQLSKINDQSSYYKEINTVVNKLHMKYNLSKKSLDEMINNKLKAA